MTERKHYLEGLHLVDINQIETLTRLLERRPFWVYGMAELTDDQCLKPGQVQQHLSGYLRDTASKLEEEAHRSREYSDSSIITALGNAAETLDAAHLEWLEMQHLLSTLLDDQKNCSEKVRNMIDQGVEL